MQKIAVVTGASSGICRALTLELASRGIYVIAVARNKQSLSEVKSKFPTNIEIIAADITTETGRASIIESVKSRHINYLVNGAGIIAPLMPLHDISEHDLRNIFETNLIAPILLTKQLIPVLNKSKSSRILNITSVAGKQTVVGAGAYCISKAGLDMWTRLLQVEQGNTSIITTNVIPGEVDTNMQQALREAQPEQFPLATEFQEAYAKSTLIKAETCASFLADILLNTINDEYTSKEWNIYRDYRGSIT